MAEMLRRIAEALERLAPPPAPPPDLAACDAFIWQASRASRASQASQASQASRGHLRPVARVCRVELGLLQGIDRQKAILLENTRQFAAGKPANNAMLWGARGMGKSSLVKAVHAAVNAAPGGQPRGALLLIEISREEIRSLPDLLNLLRETQRRCLILCDDLSFEREDADYKALKSVLDGGIEGRPENVLFYATSNRRHLMPREMLENERATAIHPGEAVEEKVSLSDRFGLWLGFHNGSQELFFSMVEAYAVLYDLPLRGEALRAAALEWSITRGARSGRVAWQFIQDQAGRA